jgi:hypothetical protein
VKKGAEIECCCHQPVTIWVSQKLEEKDGSPAGFRGSVALMTHVDLGFLDPRTVR